MKQLIIFLILLAILIQSASATWDHVGSGEQAWSENVTMDNVTENWGSGYAEIGNNGSDNFNDGDLTYWGIINSPVVINGRAELNASTYDAIQRTDMTSYANFSLQYTFNLTDVLPGDGAQLWFRGTSSGSSYQMRQRYGSTLQVRNTDGWGELALNNSLTINSNTDYILRIDMNGSDYTIYLDGIEVLSFSNSSHTSGNFKLLASQNNHYVDNVRLWDIGVTSSNITRNYTAILGAGEELQNLKYNGTLPTAILNVDIYASTDNSTWVLIQANASTNTNYDVSGNGYEYGRWKLNTTDDSQTPEIYNISAEYGAAAVAGAPSITSYAPTVTIWPEVQDSQLFNITVNQTTQCRWYVNGSLTQTNATPSLTHAYTNTSLEGGHWNFTAVVNNTNGTDRQTWLFEVGADSITYIILSEDDTNLTCLIRWNVPRIGSNVTHWNTSYSNTTAGYKYCKNYDNGTEILNQTASIDDEELWFNSSTLLLTGIYYISVCESTPGISNVQNGSISSSSQWINWTVNQTANNRVIYDTGAVSADSTACDGQWSATHACANASDGNWSSYAESAGALLAYAYFNYTVPSAANRSESLWHVKDNAGQANLTIPSACWGSTLYLRAMCSDIGNSATWQCDSGAGWTTLRTSVANIIYEEEMTFKYTSTWNNSTAAPNITLTGLTASTTYNFHARSYNLANASLSGNSSTYSFTTAAAAPYNYITLYADEYGLINNWTTAQNCSQIDANISNVVCGSWYNHTSGLWESYRSGYGYNADAEIPENNSAFIFVDVQTTVSATPHTGGVTIQNATWFYGMLPGSTAKTLTEIETEMDSDGLDVWSLYGWSNSSQAYTATGGYSVAPNEGYAVYCNVSGEFTP